MITLNAIPTDRSALRSASAIARLPYLRGPTPLSNAHGTNENGARSTLPLFPTALRKGPLRPIAAAEKTGPNCRQTKRSASLSDRDRRQRAADRPSLSGSLRGTTKTLYYSTKAEREHEHRMSMLEGKGGGRPHPKQGKLREHQKKLISQNNYAWTLYLRCSSNAIAARRVNGAVHFT